MNSEELAIISMNVITFAGEAKSLSVEALQVAKTGDYDLAKQKIKDARDKMIEAQEWHFKVLSADASEHVTLNVLFLHAEDQFMSSDTLIIIVDEMISLLESKGL